VPPQVYQHGPRQCEARQQKNNLVPVVAQQRLGSTEEDTGNLPEAAHQADPVGSARGESETAGHEPNPTRRLLLRSSFTLAAEP